MLKYLFLFMIVGQAIAQEKVLLYPAGAPGLKPDKVNVEENNTRDGILRINKVTKPDITVYKPKSKKTDAAVIICPGGGYGILAYDHEGTDLAKWYNSKGMTAVVLKYRLPEDEHFENAEIRPLEDVQQAFYYLKTNAEKYGINKDKIGIMGFSAGGHLAASASNKFNKHVNESTKAESIKPSFSVLLYPVISFKDNLAHMGSRTNLIGKDPTYDKIQEYSNELLVTKDTPPTFLVHAFDDGVHVNNSIEYFKALKKEGVSAEMHIYDRGGHGFSLKKDRKGPVATWENRLEDWLKVMNLL